MTTRVGLFPMKVGHDTRASAQFIKRKRPHLFSLTEMDLGRSTAIHIFVTVFGRALKVFTKDRGGHSQEIPWMLRKMPWVRVRDFKLFQLSEDGGNAVGGMGNDRWAARLELKIWGKVWVFWATHLDAGIQHVAAGRQLGDLLQTRAGRLRWTRYQNEMAGLEAHVKRDVLDPNIDVTVLQGDMNMLPVGDGKTEEVSPHRVYHRLKMDYVNERVGYIGVHGGRIVRKAVYPPGKNGWGSDHAGIMVWVRPR